MGESRTKLLSNHHHQRRWLQSVNDADMVQFFGDDQFDANDYTRAFFERNEAAKADARCSELGELKRQTEEALRKEVVLNYRTFMHATEQIQSMEGDIDTLKSLLGSAQGTLDAFRDVRFVPPADKDRPKMGGWKDANAAAPPAAGETSPRGGSSTSAVSSTSLSQDNRASLMREFGNLQHGGGEFGKLKPGAGSVIAGKGRLESARDLKLPQWLDRAPTELEELLLERKHYDANKLILKVREFSSNVHSARNLGTMVGQIFSRVEEMALALASRLLYDIAKCNMFTAWGFREHKKNFALLIALGHGDAAARAFAQERTSLIRRRMRMVEANADPLSYVSQLSRIFFEIVADAATSFLKLFCGDKRELARQSKRSVKSPALWLVYSGVRKSGTGPFCRLSVWVDQEIQQFAGLVGRQIRMVGVGAHLTRSPVPAPLRLRMNTGGGVATAVASPLKPGAAAGANGQKPPKARAGAGSAVPDPPPAGRRRSSWGLRGGEGTVLRLGPMAASLFSMVSLMLEEAFAEATALRNIGFCAQASLASRLTPDLMDFIKDYVDQICNNLKDVVGKEDWRAKSTIRVVPPEVLTGVFDEVVLDNLSVSSCVLVREIRDMLDYCMVLLEPPLPEEEVSLGPDEAAMEEEVGSPKQPSGPDNKTRLMYAPEASKKEACYGRDVFLHVQPMVLRSVISVMERYLDALSTAGYLQPGGAQAEDGAQCLQSLARTFMPHLSAWCEELLPEAAADASDMATLKTLTKRLESEAQQLLQNKHKHGTSTDGDVLGDSG